MPTTSFSAYCEGSPSRQCGEELVIVPDKTGNGLTVVCPVCDCLDRWPNMQKKRRRKAA